MERGSDGGQPVEANRAAESIAFGRAGLALGLPLPPESPGWDGVGALLDLEPGIDTKKAADEGLLRLLEELPH